MVIKVFFDAGEGSVKIESHSMPDFAGIVTNRQDKANARDVTVSEADAVEDIVERLTIDERDGIRLSRRIVHERIDEEKLAPDHWQDVARTICVVPRERMAEVLRVACDGEVVWPDEEAEDSSSEAEVASSLEKAAGRLEKLIG